MNHWKKINLVIVSLFLFIAFNPSTQAHALDKGVLCHIKELLGPYPAKGSPEEAADFAELFKYQETRTAEQCAAAASEVKISLDHFFGGANGPLTQDEVKRLKPLMFKYLIKSGISSSLGKFLFKRPRPYVTNPALVPCIAKSNSYAYPSGHTTMARVYARVLAKKFPERAEQFMQRGDEVAMHRVLGGVHHPSDIVAGKKLGDALTKHLFSNKEFLKELEAL